ncbi:MAG TPA: hypothetical protein VK487_05645 [Candidatus Bathyarchaeia archaeon]|nr:hypothetical protein [Candidatus Bathyarchaeia archaeon]
MNSPKTGRNWVNLLLMFLVVINIVGDVGNIAFWDAVPSSRESLMGGWVASFVGAENALTAGTIILAIVAIIYVVSTLGLPKKRKWAPLLIIAISIANRALAVFLYAFNEAFFRWFAWTIILLIVAFLDFRKISTSR